MCHLYISHWQCQGSLVYFVGGCNFQMVTVYRHFDDDDQSLKLAIGAAMGMEVLATSYSKPRHMRAGGQSTPSPSHLPSDSVRSVYSSYLTLNNSSTQNCSSAPALHR